MILFYSFGIIQLVLIGYILFKEIEKKSPVMFMWATLFLMFGLPHLVTVLVEDLPYEEITLFEASLFVVIFCLMYITFRSRKEVKFLDISNRRGFCINGEPIMHSVFETICFAILVVSIIGTLLNIALHSQNGIMNITSAEIHEIKFSYLNLNSFTIRLKHMLAGLPLYFFLTHRKKTAFFILLLQMGEVLITRNRVLMLPLFVFAISLYIIKIRRINLKHYIAGFVAAIMIIYIVYAVRAFRWLGTLADGFSNVSITYLNSMVMKFISENNGEIGLRQWFYYFIEHDNEFEGFNSGYSYIRMLLVYLPTQWSFGVKPEGFDLYMGKAIGMVTGGSMHPTLFGDCFANFYWFGVFLGAFWAVFANSFDIMISCQRDCFHRIMIFFMGSCSYVIMGRGSVYNGFEETAWGILFLYLLDLTFGRLCKVKLKFINQGFKLINYRI